MLPPGPHLVSYNAASRTGDFAPTISFFTHLKMREVLIRRWDAEQELLLELHPDEVLHAFDATYVLAPHTPWFKLVPSKVSSRQHLNSFLLHIIS